MAFRTARRPLALGVDLLQMAYADAGNEPLLAAELATKPFPEEVLKTMNCRGRRAGRRGGSEAGPVKVAAGHGEIG
jgi:hypothetical protein